MNDKTQNQRSLISVIGDEDTVTGLLLSGIGNIDSKNSPNFLIVDASKLLFEMIDRNAAN